MTTIGDLCENRGEVVFQWKIRDFSSLSNEMGVYYASPKFYFSGASWSWWIYPNGMNQHQTDGWIGLYLMRTSSGSPVSLECLFGVKTVEGNSDPELTFTHVFHKRDLGYGSPRLISRSRLMERKTELIPADVLTVICTLKNNERNDVAGSLFRRLQDVSDNLKEMYLKAKTCDFNLKLNEGNIAAHRIILETRSPVFAAMFSHDTKEKQTGEMSIEDVDKSTMNILLVHMYSGDFGGLTTQNVLSIYAAAEKYDVKDAREICAEFIIRNLSAECVCDVIKFAELYQEEKINRCARDYLKENAGKILESENWKIFVKENHDLGVELYDSLVKTLLPK